MKKETVDFEAQKSFLKILTSLQYKPLSNINRSEKWGKKIYKPRVIMARVQ